VARPRAPEGARSRRRTAEPAGSERRRGLGLGGDVQLHDTVSTGLVVISTSFSGAAEIVRRGRALSADRAYRGSVSDRSGRATSLLFLDFSQLLSLGEQTGLARSASYGALRADLARIRAVGLHATGGEADSTAELFLQIP
jgi:hypothetical protein